MIAEGYYEEDPVPASPAPYDEATLLANGFVKSTTKLSKHVGTSGIEDPADMSRVPLEPMSPGNKWVPHGGYSTSPPPISPRAELLREAEELITGDRNETYGTPTENFEAIASFWNVQFNHGLQDGFKFTGAHVAQAMSLVKLARMRAQPRKDNWTDLAGYAACGYECDVQGGNDA